MDRFATAGLLREIGALLELQGDNPFKARAYERGARALEGFSGDLDALVAERRLTTLPGVGTALAATIAEIVGTGRSEQLERLRRQLPPGILELSRVPHLTVPRIRALHQALGVSTVAELKTAAEAGRVRGVKGFGPRTEEKVLAGIRAFETRGEEVLLYEAERAGEALLAYARATPGVQQADLAGALRRRTEVVDRVVITVATADPAAAVERFARYPQVVAVTERDLTGATARLADGLIAELRAAPPAAYAGLLHEMTGSAAHRARLAQRAKELGLELDRRGLVRLRTRRRCVVKTEADVYRHLGLPFMPPELREDVGEVEAALAGELPGDLLEVSDIQGLVHCHTVYSDGRHSVEQMARAAEEMGMRYITITDHSPTASYAGGLTLDRLKRQWEEIDRAQEKVKVRLLRGTESDILADGSLDYPDPVLEKMDVVIASIHNRYKMDEAQMTRRVVTALRNPFFKVWGHALGRYVRSRPPIAVRMDEVLDAAAESRVAIEVNGDPHRLDLEPRWQREARRRGIRFVVSTDAHSTRELRNLRYGVDMARRGWLRKADVLNTRSVEEFREAVRPS
jgi:DNA polymerase (family 10)